MMKLEQFVWIHGVKGKLLKTGGWQGPACPTHGLLSCFFPSNCSQRLAWLCDSLGLSAALPRGQLEQLTSQHFVIFPIHRGENG